MQDETDKEKDKDDPEAIPEDGPEDESVGMGRDASGQDWMDDLQICLGFLTRIPVPGGPAVGNPSLAEATRFFPLIGMLVGAIAVVVLLLADGSGLPISVSTLLALIAAAVVTGGLHEDGLADSADGLGGGFTKEAALEIMRDSRIGSFGVLALLFSVGLKWGGLSSMSVGGAALALFAAHTASRGILPLYMRYIPLARSDGLSADAGQPEFDRAALSLLIAAVVLFFIFGFWLTIGTFFVIAVVAGALVWWVNRRIGGQTGDILGALQQVTEIILILAAAAGLA